MTKMIGKTISHYKILAHVGQGGMGVVYKAKDTRLFRSVAIKILPPHLVADEKNRLRLVQEARAASSLNHPNICTVHDIGDEKGVHYIVMEFVEGQTLGEILKIRGPLPETEVIDIGIKLCYALSAAHNKGIIHRDMKPDNIMITQNGRIKVMDFGLAKLLNSEHEQLYVSTLKTKSHSSINLLKTSMSTFQGTAAYMAPEQIEKKRLDARTDIFAIGVVLYELLTGTPPFVGKDSVAVMKSILRDNPKPVSDTVPDISPEVEAAVLMALAKEPEARYQSLSELLSVFKKRREGRRPGVAFRRSWTVLLSLILLSLLIGFYFTISQNFLKKRVAIKPEIRTYPLVTSPYYENLPAISPDGGRVAYVSDQSGNLDIWTKEIDGSKVVNITRDYEGQDTEPAWSPDGTNLIFRSGRDSGGLFIISLATNQVRQVSKFGKEPCWSPDNEWVAFVGEVTNMGSNEIWLMKLYTGKPERFFTPTHVGFRIADLSWSSDGNWLLYKLLHGSRKEIHAVSLRTKKNIEILKGKYNYAKPALSQDMKFLYFLTDQGGVVDVWKTEISLSQQNIEIIDTPQNKTVGIGMVNFSISGNGERLAYIKAPFAATAIYTAEPGQGSIFVMALAPDKKIGFLKRKSLGLGFVDVLDPEFSPDGKWIAFEADLGGKYDVWLSSVTGDGLRNITDDTNKNTGPSWSPDGKWLAYDSGGGNNAEIRIIPLAGGEPIQLTNNNWADWMPDWSPDGKNLIYSSNKTGNWDIWRIRLDDRVESQLTFNTGFDYGAQWSPDGNKIAFISDRDEYNNVWMMSVNGEDFQQLTHFTEEGIGRTLGWDPSGDKIYFYRFKKNVNNIYACYLSTSKIEQFTFIKNERRSMSDFGGLSVHENKIVYRGGGTIESDIWVMDYIGPNE